MGREARRVPPGWEHPRDGGGKPVPLSDHYGADLAEWEEGYTWWQRGYTSSLLWCRDAFAERAPYAIFGPRVWSSNTTTGSTWEEYAGERPQQCEYMPDWPEEERTHWQVYEDTTEGTPISPVCATVEECARWCADTGTSAFGREPASYEWWLAVLRDGHFSGLVVTLPQGAAMIPHDDSAEGGV